MRIDVSHPYAGHEQAERNVVQCIDRGRLAPLVVCIGVNVRSPEPAPGLIRSGSGCDAIAPVECVLLVRLEADRGGVDVCDLPRDKSENQRNREYQPRAGKLTAGNKEVGQEIHPQWYRH